MEINKEKVMDLIDAVVLNPEHARRYPYQMSGRPEPAGGSGKGSCVKPRFIVADEPTSASTSPSWPDFLL